MYQASEKCSIRLQLHVSITENGNRVTKHWTDLSYIICKIILRDWVSYITGNITPTRHGQVPAEKYSWLDSYFSSGGLISDEVLRDMLWKAIWILLIWCTCGIRVAAVCPQWTRISCGRLGDAPVRLRSVCFWWNMIEQCLRSCWPEMSLYELSVSH